VLLLLTGCAKTKAAAVPDGPPLAVPMAPAHEIPVQQIAEAPPEEPPPAPDPPAPTPKPAVTRPPARPDTRTQTPAPAAAQPTPPAQAPTEVREVRAAPPASPADEQKVRDLMKKAADDLKGVDYQKLSKEGKAQYDQSKRFSDEAQQAVKERNFVYAMTLAEKAATLAAELVR
jgi:hypothetical protein